MGSKSKQFLTSFQTLKKIYKDQKTDMIQTYAKGKIFLKKYKKYYPGANQVPVNSLSQLGG
jgi:hypothetical protein